MNEQYIFGELQVVVGWCHEMQINLHPAGNLTRFAFPSAGSVVERFVSCGKVIDTCVSGT